MSYKDRETIANMDETIVPGYGQINYGWPGYERAEPATCCRQQTAPIYDTNREEERRMFMELVRAGLYERNMSVNDTLDMARRVIQEWRAP